MSLVILWTHGVIDTGFLSFIIQTRMTAYFRIWIQADLGYLVAFLHSEELTVSKRKKIKHVKAK